VIAALGPYLAAEILFADARAGNRAKAGDDHSMRHFSAPFR
jgi:hypothetical protein